MTSVNSTPAGDLLKSDSDVAAKVTSDNEAVSDHTEGDALVAIGRTGDSTSIVQKTFPKTNAIELCAYNMSSPHRGHAVIVNNETFYPVTRMNKRIGTDVDSRNLERIYKKLGFKVHVHKNATVNELVKILEDMAATDHTGNDCFLFSILSHGDDGCVYGTDGTVEIACLVNLFRGDNCPTLAGKPKIFLFQACRGTLHEIPVDRADDVVDAVGGAEEDNLVEADAGPAPTLPSGSDFLFCYSVVEGFYSHRDTLYGSWYVQEFTHVMNKLVLKKDSEPVDFLDILTMVNRRVANRSVERCLNQDALGKKQMPCFLSMLTKKLYLTKK